MTSSPKLMKKEIILFHEGTSEKEGKKHCLIPTTPPIRTKGKF